MSEKRIMVCDKLDGCPNCGAVAPTLNNSEHIDNIYYEDWFCDACQTAFTEVYEYKHTEITEG